MPDSNALKEEFLNKLSHFENISQLFENIPNLFFWIKNIKGEFIMVNQGVIEKAGCRSEEDMIGKTDYDFWPKKLCDDYRKDDLKVVTNKQRIINKIELVAIENGIINWHSTNKIPLFDKKSEVIGIAGITQDLNRTDKSSKTYVEMADVIEYISKNFTRSIEVNTLANIASLSLSQFERKFKQYFNQSPINFINKVRITSACKELLNSNKTISSIAYSMGFYDQSYFSKRFILYMGITPKEYRKKYFNGICCQTHSGVCKTP